MKYVSTTGNNQRRTQFFAQTAPKKEAEDLSYTYTHNRPTKNLQSQFYNQFSKVYNKYLSSAVKQLAGPMA